MVPLEMQLFPSSPHPPFVTNGLSGLKPLQALLDINLLPGPRSIQVAFKRERKDSTDLLCLMPRQISVFLADD